MTPQEWIISDENGEITDSMQDYTVEYEDDKLKLKVARNYELVGKVLTIQVIDTNGRVGEIQMEVIG